MQAALSKGDFVIALSRGILELRQQEIQNLQGGPNVQSVEGGATAALGGAKIWSHERCLCIRCDVRLKAQVETAVKKGIEHFGNLDVVVKYLSSPLLILPLCKKITFSFPVFCSPLFRS